MGLDMYMKKATKPNINTRKVYELEELEKQGYTCFETPDGTVKDYMKDLKPFMVRVRCIAEYYDTEKIAQHYGWEGNARWGGFGPDGIYFNNGSSENYQRAVVAREDIKNFTYKKTVYFHVTHLEEVGYWRKEYELDDKLTKHFLSARGVVVENCGYYRMTKAAMKIVENYTKNHDTEPVFYEPEEIRSLFYHNWY